ncbi:Golgi apparatus protein 1 isoform X1 [Eupeodes corollae]|uniref:Golgi apparatus protein 1 isoform X1 n=1 Tax=Eupeodes corollae TaxID=290404 RepID=UPI0024917152|nr:Golgi apparatus protein 1 isoform X1 [Eupeodes corollae]
MKLSMNTLLIFLLGLTIYPSASANDNLLRFSRAALANNAKVNLIDNPACPEIKNLCDHSKSLDDLSILECIETFPPHQLESLTNKCQQVIWNSKRLLLADHSVHQLVDQPCEKHEAKLAECYNSIAAANSADGTFLSCLIDKSSTLDQQSPCKNVIQRIQSVVFNDFRFLNEFFQGCDNDIQQLHCGRMNVERTAVSQIETVACLQDSLDNLSPTCKSSVGKHIEYQFTQICGDDLRRFCVSEHPGTSAAYKCLVKHKSNPDMTGKCREQIIQRDKILAKDYRMSRGLAKACKDDIRVHHCRRGVSDDKNVRLAQILLCLESVIKNGTKILEECRIEINDHRRMLLLDYQLSPEILIGCADDIPKFCGDNDFIQNTAGGEIIHCLMDHARPKRRKDRRVTSTCQRAIEQLVKTSDVGEDWRVDPVLRRACKPVVDVACTDTDGGEARVMTCLMEHIGTQVMTPDCEQALLLIQYFVARDFKLDPQLYKNCKQDAVKYCRAKKSWDDVNDAQMDPERGPLILPCLHRIAYSADTKIVLRSECYKEVKRVMRQRAISVELIPEVEDVCLEDLSTFCYDKTKKGEEMNCLQENLEKLQTNCKAAVTSYTEEEAGHVELNPIIMSVCSDAMNTHCGHILKRKDDGDMMDCLISHKNDADLRQDLKCRAAIEHFQIISLKNYHFTYKFKEACRPYVVRFCAASTTKNEVVSCLSEVMRNDTIRGQRHSIPKECRQQVKAQLYQQRESILLDPKLANACKKELSEFCNDATGPGQVMKNALECLSTNTARLGNSCHHAMFLVKKSELGDSATDYTLVNTCREMTYKFCPSYDTSRLLDCLKVYKDDPQFDSRCHLVVVNRMIEQNTDFRFNPSLQLACGKNIDQYCSHIVAQAKPYEELNGKVIECLKIKFREARLEEKCEQKINIILHDQALNYKLNPLLLSFCKSEIEVLCKPRGEIEEHGIVEECLKTAFLNQKIINRECKIEVATLIAEAKADIHVDPILEEACTVDLLRYCSNVKSGNGRKLKCLQTILQDQSKAMEEDCRNKLRRRIEMFQNADTVLALPPENMEQLVSQVISSPAKRFFLVILLTCLGMVFIMGMFLGRFSKRAMTSKNK